MGIRRLLRHEPGRAERIIRDNILSDPRALEDPEPWFQVTNLGDFSVDFTVCVSCKATDFWDFKSDMTRKVKEALDIGGIEMPFPTHTVLSSETNCLTVALTPHSAKTLQQSFQDLACGRIGCANIATMALPGEGTEDREWSAL